MNTQLLLPAVVIALVASPVFAQDTKKTDNAEAAYTKTINERADKIVATLGVNDPTKSIRVRDLIAQQYRSLRAIHDPRDVRITAAKATAKENKSAADAEIKAAQDEAKSKQDKLHGEYLAKL